MDTASTLFFLLIVASCVAMCATRIRLPYTVALVVAGLALGGIEHLGFVNLDAVRLTPELLFTLFLPALLFEAAFHLSWPKFQANLRAILLLAVPGVAAAILIAGLLAFYAEHWVSTELSLAVSFLFVAMCVATDPVSVVALFKELGVPKRLAVLMEGESLLNDGVAVVAFIVIGATLGLTQHAEPISAGWIAQFLFWEIAIGIGVGVLIGLVVSYLTTLVDDHLIEIMLTTIAAFGSYLVANGLHASGVLAVVAAGMASGNVGARYGMTPTNRVAVESFWEYAVFAANSFVFLLLGKEIDLGRMFSQWPAILVAWLALMVARAIVVFLVSGVLRSTTEALPKRWPVVLVWGGLRGSLSMVLVLSLPDTFASKQDLVDLVFGVVLVSILVQGLTMSSILKWSGAVLGDAVHREYMGLRGRLSAVRAASRELDAAYADGAIHANTYEVVRGQLGGREAELEERLDNFDPGDTEVHEGEMKRLSTRLLMVERKAVQEAMKSGVLNDDVARKLLDEITERSVLVEKSTKGDQPAAPLGYVAEPVVQNGESSGTAHTEDGDAEPGVPTA